MLKLTPILQDSKITDITASAESVDWLDNNDASLLEPEASQGKSNTIQSAIKHVSDDVSARTFCLQHLDLMANGSMIQIKDAEGAWFTLNNHDVIELPGVTLKVEFTDDEIEDASHNNRAYYDIWGDTNEQNSETRKIIDPFQSTQPIVPMQPQAYRHDYYSSNTTPSLTTNNFSSNTTSLPDLNNTGLSGDLMGHYENRDGMNSLTVNSEMDYLPAQASSALMRDMQVPVLSNNANTQGNVLRDLGINEQASALANTTVVGNEKSFMEQSPLDLMDECWDGMQERSVGVVALRTNLPSMNVVKQDMGLFTALKGVTKKVFG